MPEAYRVDIQPKASGDIVRICTYIAQRSPQNAVSVAKQLSDAIDSLQLFPHRFKVYRSHRSPKLIIRSMPVPPFVIYYRVVEAQRAVEVLTVRHGARRQPGRL